MLNPFAQARFQMSCARLDQCPSDDAPELAFAGRSNSGKSSALNALCAQKGLARVSKTPGRTQLINLFELPSGRRLVDLPGYGYAEVPSAMRRDWASMVGGYVEKRRNLCGIVLIMDCRHPLTSHDRQLLDWVIAAGTPCHVLLSKADKLGFGAGKTALLGVQRELGKLGAQARVQLFSVPSKLGLDEARESLAVLLGLETAPSAAQPESQA